MQRVFIYLSLVLVSLFAYAQEPVVFEEPQDGAKIAFMESSFDFGDIIQGAVVEHIFEFQNKGNQPLLLADVRTTCGCTAPSWPKEPIAPGAKSAITIKFNSRGKIGVQNKIITIMSNATNSRETIKIQTNVTLPNNQ